MIDERLLKNEERAVFNLRSLYRKYGYMPYRMSKFEEYELYIRNKDFLVSDRIITFNDTNGKLLALKPDVTLSIIRSGEDIPGTKQKVYYNENVYRVSESTHRFKEIMQAGLECIGDIDIYDVYEVISLAAKSLAVISDNFVVEISHLGLISSALEKICPDKLFCENAIKFISEKNSHDLKKLCDEYSVSESDAQKLISFVTAYGERNKVLAELSALFDGKELDEMKELCAMLDNDEFSGRIRIDFSVVNDMRYYNGFVFKGFLDGVCDGVLAGGQYDKMMQRMGRKSGAIGFAIYLDLLEQLETANDLNKVDVLLVYNDGVKASSVSAKVKEIIDSGRTVSVQKSVPDRLRYKEIIDMTKEGD